MNREERRRYIEDVKARVDMLVYVENDLGEPDQRKYESAVWKCPITGERTPSFVVHSDHFKCFGACGHGGDIFRYVQLRTGCDFNEALALVAQGVNLEAPPVVHKTEPKPRKVLQLKDIEGFELLRERVVPYLVDARKLAPDVLETNHIGAMESTHNYITGNGTPHAFRCNYVALPYVFGDRVLSINFRRDETSADAFLATKQPGILDAIRLDMAEKQQCSPIEITDMQVRQAMFGRHYNKPTWAQAAVYGCDEICELRGGCLHYPEISAAGFAEGEISKLAAQSLGYLCLGAKASKKLDLRRCTQNIRNKYIFVENDGRYNAKGHWEHPGLLHAMNLYDQLGGEANGARLVRLPEGFKDLNDLLILGELEYFLATHCIGLEPREARTP